MGCATITRIAWRNTKFACWLHIASSTRISGTTNVLLAKWRRKSQCRRLNMELQLEVVLSSSIKRKKPWPRFCWLGKVRLQSNKLKSSWLIDDDSDGGPTPSPSKQCVFRHFFRRRSLCSFWMTSASARSTWSPAAPGRGHQNCVHCLTV